MKVGKSVRNTVVLAILFLAYTGIYVARLNLAAASVPLESLHILSTSKYGVIAGVFSAVYAVGRLLNGALSDYLHPAWTLSIGLAVTGLSNLLFSLFPPYVLLLILWGLNAYAQSMLWSSILRVVTTLYSGKKAKTVTSYMVTSVALGNIVGMVLSAQLVERLGVRFAFLVPGVLVIVFCLACLIVLPKIPVQPRPDAQHMSIVRLFGDRDVRRILLPVLFHGVVKDNIGNYIFQYLTTIYFIRLSDTAYLAMLIPIMGLIGRLSYPLWYRLSGCREHHVSTYAFLVAAAVTVPLLFKTSVLVAALCMGVIYAATSVVNTTALSIFPLQYAESGNVASVSGLMDFAAYLGCAVGSTVYGVVIEAVGYGPMLWSWLILALLSAVLLHPFRQAER